MSDREESVFPGEGQRSDFKSIRKVTGSSTDFAELAQDCVCFANASGGCLFIGVEDGLGEPPPDQRVETDLPDRVRKRVGELTVNVEVHPEIRTAGNGGQYLVLTVPRSVGVASTCDGRYFVRVGDTCRPVVGDDVLRLADERPATPWEVMISLGVARSRVDQRKLAHLLSALRASDRVNASVKEKTDRELLDHYHLAAGEVLTNLGVLLLGLPEDRARLGTAPVVQAIKYDERGQKVAKYVWDDHALSPVELIEAIWLGIPDFRESYEMADGILRANIPAYDESVLRELLVNALVHRPYTQRGDIFINLHPDRLEVVNAGRLPFGVTPDNILHATRRRNDILAKVFHDLKLMEREGSGFDLMYELLLASGRAVPKVSEGGDSVHVLIQRRIVHPGVVNLIAKADRRFQLRQRERIVLGLLGQSEGLSAAELARALELPDPGELRDWLSRLVDLELVKRLGKTKATRYFVDPFWVREASLDDHTTLHRIELHRLKALVVEDLQRYPDSAISDIRRRIGEEIPERSLRRALKDLLAGDLVGANGKNRWRRYSLRSSIGQGE